MGQNGQNGKAEGVLGVAPFCKIGLRKQMFFLYLHHSEPEERCLRGRKEQFAKLSYWKRYRGFESRSLRYPKMPLM